MAKSSDKSSFVEVFGNIDLCPLQQAQGILAGKWKLVILWILSKRVCRTHQIKKLMPQVSQKVLIQQLRELEEDDMVHRKTYPEVPPRVEYSLSEKGKTFVPILKKLETWGRRV